MAQANNDIITNSAGSNVIEFVPRQQAKGAEALMPPNGGLGVIHSQSLLALPFVTLPPAEVTDWKEFWEQTSLWNDQPTNASSADYHRGIDYAKCAVAAIVKDRALSHDLQLVVGRIISGGFRRKGPGGKLCRGLAAAEEGFIYELCKIAVESSRLAVDLSLDRGQA